MALCRNAKGRAVYAARSIRKGEVLLDCPVLIFTGERVLVDYRWVWSRDRYAIPVGLANFFNHSTRPNVTSRRYFAQERMVFTALRRIARGEELLIDYGGPIPFKVLPPGV